ncbi:OmpA family protein [Oscillospiraceae bacterium CM]|nr:OmpA family protein [Oscillospiraceae bacterium CM]
MARNNNKPKKDNSERWLVTYADLMNLLLILFIILFAASQIDKAKAAKVAQSVRSGFGYQESGADASASDGSAASSPGSDQYWSPEGIAYQQFYEDVIKLIQENNLTDMVDVTMDDRGVVISFKDNVLYPSGQANLSAKSLALIDNIGSLLNHLTYSFILVEGHTDTDPIHTAEYIDNMDLSTQRATNVWRELIKMGISPTNTAAIGYGEYRPIAPNDTAANKAKNRRVVITILRKEVAASDQTALENSNAATQSAAS